MVGRTFGEQKGYRDRMLTSILQSPPAFRFPISPFVVQEIRYHQVFSYAKLVLSLHVQHLPWWYWSLMEREGTWDVAGLTRCFWSNISTSLSSEAWCDLGRYHLQVSCKCGPRRRSTLQSTTQNCRWICPSGERAIAPCSCWFLGSNLVRDLAPVRTRCHVLGRMCPQMLSRKILGCEW